MGKFSTDRTIEEYAKDIWHITPCRRLAPVTDAMGRARSFPQLAGMEGRGMLAGPTSPSSPRDGVGMELGAEAGRITFGRSGAAALAASNGRR
jgi:hypothetical protein